MIPIDHDPGTVIGGLAVLAGIALWATAGVLWLTRPGRREAQEPPHPAGPPPHGLPPRPCHRADADDAPNPLVPLLGLLGHRPARTGRHREVPAVHVGATEDWSPAAEVGDAGQSADVMTPAQQLAADHAALAGIGDALAEFSARMDELLDRACGGDPALRLAVARHGTSTVADTGVLDLAELDGLLAADLAGAR